MSSLQNAAADAASGTFQTGVQAIGCEAQQAFQQVVGYYFTEVVSQMNVIGQDIEYLKLFFGAVLGYSALVTKPASYWVDGMDQSFQSLVCYIDDDGSRIWRTVSKHSTLHAGLNQLASLQNVAEVNLVVQIVELVIKLISNNLLKEFSDKIGAAGALMQGWTQTWRICSTKWDLGNLEKPGSEEADEEDEDEYVEPWSCIFGFVIALLTTDFPAGCHAL